MFCLEKFPSKSMTSKYFYAQIQLVLPCLSCPSLHVAVVSNDPVAELSADSLAQSFLQSSIYDPTDSVLLDTLSDSIHSVEDLGLGPAEEEGMFATVLAAFVEALKSRLAVEIEGLNLLVQHSHSADFILSLSQISFLPRPDSIAEKVLTLNGIEAYLRSVDGSKGDDNISVTSDETITRPSSPSADGSDDHGLSQSMMFSPQEASSLYLSAYSHPSHSEYHDPSLNPSREPISPQPIQDAPVENTARKEGKGFRFFYFEDNLVFRVTTTQPTRLEGVRSPTTYSPPTLQSVVPTANLILHPNVNLLPTISLISTILSLSPPSPSPTAASVPSDISYGIDLSFSGGVAIHFGSENASSIARFSDCKVRKATDKEDMEISLGIMEIISSAGEKLLNMDNSSETNSRLNIIVGPNAVDVSLPQVDLKIDVEGVKTLQPLVQAMKLAWLETPAVPPTPAPQEPSDSPDPNEDEDWNENLLVETMQFTNQAPRQLNFAMERLSFSFPASEEVADALVLTIDDISFTMPYVGKTSFEFSSANVSLASNRLLSISSPSTAPSMFNILFSETSSIIDRPQTQEILDDFLMGDQDRSDDAWGILRSEAAEESSLVVKIRLPAIDLDIQGPQTMEMTKHMAERLGEMLHVFVEPQPQNSTPDSPSVKMIVEFAIGGIQARMQLGENDMIEARVEGFEGTVVWGVSGGETVGVVDITRISLGATSNPPRKILDESIEKVFRYLIDLI
jgi:Atg2, N-terminal